jgi:hypothetical protein
MDGVSEIETPKPILIQKTLKILAFDIKENGTQKNENMKWQTKEIDNYVKREREMK